MPPSNASTSSTFGFSAFAAGAAAAPPAGAPAAAATDPPPPAPVKFSYKIIDECKLFYSMCTFHDTSTANDNNLLILCERVMYSYLL